MGHEQLLHVVASGDAIGDAFSKVLLAESDIGVRSWSSVEDFLSNCPPGSLEHACVLVEAELPGADGIELLSTLRRRGERAPMLVLTRSSDRAVRRKALAAGATDVLDRSLIEAFLLQRLAQLWPGAASHAPAGASTVALRDGTQVTYRRMEPGDAEIEQEFVRGLSDESRYMRFFSSLRELPPDLLKEFTNPHYPLSYALIATVEERRDGAPRERQIGVARYVPTEDPDTAEFAVVVADDWQRRGIASQLMRVLIAAAAVAGVRTLVGLVLRDNPGMLDLCAKLGFEPAGRSGDPGVVRLAKELRAPDA